MSTVVMLALGLVDEVAMDVVPWSSARASGTSDRSMPSISSRTRTS